MDRISGRCTATCGLALGASLLVLVSVPAEEAPPAAGRDRLIADVLPPHRVGAAMCLEGSFTGKAVDVEDWNKTTGEPVPGSFQFGKQVMRPVPERRPDQSVSLVQLHLVQEKPVTDGEDRHYGFRLLVQLEGWGEPLLAAGDCTYRSRAREMDYSWKLDATTTTLYCGIDCDGGGMQVARAGDSRELEFEFGETGLRMSGGCSRGNFRVGGVRRDRSTGRPEPGQAPQPTFRLHRVAGKSCVARAKWND